MCYNSYPKKVLKNHPIELLLQVIPKKSVNIIMYTVQAVATTSPKKSINIIQTVTSTSLKKVHKNNPLNTILPSYPMSLLNYKS